MIQWTNTIDAESYAALRHSVGWFPFPENRLQQAMDQSACIVSAWDGQWAVGLGRMVGDGMYYLIVDVMVDPEYQHRGIGREIMERLLECSQAGLAPGDRVSVQLIAEPGKEGFYESLGFKRIPHEYCGTGMRKNAEKGIKKRCTATNCAAFDHFRRAELELRISVL